LSVVASGCTPAERQVTTDSHTVNCKQYFEKRTMNRFFFLIFFLLLRELVFTQVPVKNVLYGERSLNSLVRIYFDKNGDVYPDYYIADSALEQSNSSLSSWYKKYPSAFKQIAQQYNCTFEVYSDTNAKMLNDCILANLAEQINSNKASSAAVTFMIHGFRKPFKDTLNEYTSRDDFETLEATMSTFGLPGLSVEVYWDAMYGSGFGLRPRKNKVLFHLFETSQENAINVGRQLRKLLLNIPSDTINVVSHSLGAKVAAEALFNPFRESIALTPSNKCVNICLIAPAIAGIETFQNYYNRRSQVDFKTKDNYRLGIIYNENDFVLKKKDNWLGWFGPGAKKYGNTSLGCNCDHAATNLENYFRDNYPNSTIRLFDLSSVGKCHYFGQCYAHGKNLQAMVNFMKEKN
jgi:hypothetical protein